MDIHAACQDCIWRKWLSPYPTRTVQPVFNGQDHITEDYFGVFSNFPKLHWPLVSGKLDWLEWFSLESPGSAVDARTLKSSSLRVSGCRWDIVSERICRPFHGNASSCFEGTQALLFDLRRSSVFHMLNVLLLNNKFGCFPQTKTKQNNKKKYWSVCEVLNLLYQYRLSQSLWQERIAIYCVLMPSVCVRNKTDPVWFTLSDIFELQSTLPLSLLVERTKSE